MILKRKYLFYSVVSLFAVILILFIRHKIKNENNYEIVKESASFNGIKDGIHINTGLKDAEGLPLVIAHCTGCHSAKLITQNRLSKDGWQEVIKWMQETQNLWDLGEDEESIVAYLSKNYAPSQKGRREPLKNIEWYALED